MQADPFPAVLALAAGRDDVVLSREARQLGLSPRELAYLRSAESQPLVRGAVAVPPVRDPLRAAARAAQLVMPDAVISHATAAHLHGLQGLGFWAPGHAVDLTRAPTRTGHQRAGARVHFRRLTQEDVVDVRGLRVTTVARTLADCGLFTDRVSYVSLVDSAINRRMFPAERVAELAEALRRTRCRPAAQWLALVDGRSESPSETKVRIVLVDNGLPPDDLQVLVFNKAGFVIARVDIGYDRGAHQVGVEVDSRWHDKVRPLYRDRDKHNAFRGSGWDVRQVTAYDAVHRPRYIVAQVREALGLR